MLDVQKNCCITLRLAVDNKDYKIEYGAKTFEIKSLFKYTTHIFSLLTNIYQNLMKFLENIWKKHEKQVKYLDSLVKNVTKKDVAAAVLH
jgi:hypothetical protein